MFPPNHSENSFEWFRNQNQKIDENFNYQEMNQLPIEMQRYYGNTIQPYSENPTLNTQQQPVQTQQTHQSQQTTMIEPSTYGGQSSQSGSYGPLSQGQPSQSGIYSQLNHGQYTSTQHLSMQQPAVSYYQGYQYDPNYYGMMQNQNPYTQSNPSQYGNQMNYFTQPQNHQYSIQPQHAQMIQQGPFTSPAMFAPSTPYPTQPKKVNQQNNSQQSFQFSSILNQFKNSSGSYDVPKMMSTAGQMMNTMNQVGGIFKQIGVLFK